MTMKFFSTTTKNTITATATIATRMGPPSSMTAPFAPDHATKRRCGRPLCSIASVPPPPTAPLPQPPPPTTTTTSSSERHVFSLFSAQGNGSGRRRGSTMGAAATITTTAMTDSESMEEKSTAAQLSSEADPEILLKTLSMSAEDVWDCK